MVRKFHPVRGASVNAAVPSARAGRLPQLPRRHKYNELLALLLTSIVIQTYGLHSGFAGTLSDIFRTVLVVTIFLVVFRGTRERVPAALLLLGMVVVGWTRYFTGAGNEGLWHWPSTRCRRSFSGPPWR